MDASVVVPTHGGAHRLPELLEAMARQDFAGEWELVVVVDGVVDDTLQVLDVYRSRVPLRTVVHEVSLGVVEVLNDAFARSKGEVLIRCDDDLTPGHDFVRLHHAHHEARTDVGVIGPTRDVFPDTGYARVYGRRTTERSLTEAYARPREQRWIGWAANNSLHRDAWTCAGGFDPRFVYGEDSELGWRLAHECGVSIIVDPALQVDHRGPSTSAATKVPRAFVSGASRRLFYLAHPSERVAGPASLGFRDRFWGMSVSLLARTLRTKSAYERVGRFLDAILEITPGGLGRVLVALSVEAASRSGQLHGHDDLRLYRSQKDAELRNETRRLKRR